MFSAALLAALAAMPAQAQHARGHWGGGHGGYHGGGFWPFVAGITLGLGVYELGTPVYYPRTVLVTPPLVIAGNAPPPAPPAPPAQPLVPATPEPVIYPRNGQSNEQLEADRQACNRWATTVPAAMADASVFQRATAACMDGRGYTLR
jgi:hypothetical protein